MITVASALQLTSSRAKEKLEESNGGEWYATHGCRARYAMRELGNLYIAATMHIGVAQSKLEMPIVSSHRATNALQIAIQ